MYKSEKDIKFRAWDDDNQKIINWENIKTGFMQGFFTNKYNVNLMQYTGLKDNKDKEIYDGDIFKDWQGCLNIVRWNKFKWVFQTIKEKDFKHLSSFHNVGEVIGNIYENGDLFND